MSREDPQFKFRLPAELKAKLDQRAKMNGRSINSELVQIVQKALSEPSPIAGYRDEAERLADPPLLGNFRTTVSPHYLKAQLN